LLSILIENDDVRVMVNLYVGVVKRFGGSKLAPIWGNDEGGKCGGNVAKYV